MSAYAYQMEQQYSARSLSEIGSRFEVESGFYMTSFTATIFIAGLVTFGVLLITLLISLVVMLQSCESKNAGVIELQNINDDYSYCRIFAFHTELNNVEAYNLPKVCRAFAIQYIRGGQYARDLYSTKSVIEDYFNSIRPSDDGLDVVLIDVDDIFPSNPRTSNLYPRFHNYRISDCVREAKNLKLTLILRLYMDLQAGGWPIILFSRQPGTHQNVTTNNLTSAGFRGWSSLMMRAEDEDSKGNEYLSRKSYVIQRKGFRIKCIISNHMDTLAVQGAGMRNFKLPDPMCDKFEQQMESTDTAS